MKPSTVFGLSPYSISSLIGIVLMLAMSAWSQTPPSISMQPASVNAARGGNAQFRVAALGTTPLSYQWMRDGVTIEGATTNSLTITNVQPADAGTYNVVVTNALGRVTSSNATLVVGSIAIWGNYPNAQRIAEKVPLALTNPAVIVGGNLHMVAIDEDETVKAWGFSVSSIVTNVPSGLSDVVAIAAGVDTSLAVKANGSVTAWGGNNTIRNVPANLTNATQAAVGVSHAVALQKNGSVTSWGNQGVIPPEAGGAISVAADQSQSLAVVNGRLALFGGFINQFKYVPEITNALVVTSGRAHWVVLNRDGTVVAGGANSYGETNVPPGISNAVAVAAGPGLSLALTEGGVIHAWGISYKTNMPATLTNIVGIAAGDQFSAALINDGRPAITVQPQNHSVHSGDPSWLSVRAAGVGPLNYQWFYEGAAIPGATNKDFAIPVFPEDSGAYYATITNQIGSVTSRVAQLTVLGQRNVRVWGSPTDLSLVPFGLTNVVAVAVRSNHVVTLDHKGDVAQWGMRAFGFTNGFAILSGAKAIAAGLRHTLMLTTNGMVYESGLGSLPSIVVKSPISATNIIAIAAGDSHALALNSTGKVLAWGANQDGQTIVPTDLTNVVAVAGGRTFSMALQADGSVRGWGKLNGLFAAPPLANVVAISAAGSHALALREDGTVVAWGDNSYGQTEVPADATNIVAITAGVRRNLALRSNGSLLTWGAPGEALDIPEDLGNVISFACGVTNSVAVVGTRAPVLHAQPRDRTLTAGNPLSITALVSGQQVVFQWYQNGVLIEGVTGQTYTVPRAQVDATGSYTFVASNEFGSVTSHVAQVTVSPARSIAAWGFNGVGQTAVPPGLSDVVKVSAGSTHSLALREDGNVIGWGDNSYGQLTIPSGPTNLVPAVTNLIDIAAGPRFSMGLRQDGRVLVWGDSSSSTTVKAIPSTAHGAKAIAAGDIYAAAIKSNGTLISWGGFSMFGTPDIRLGTLADPIAVEGGTEHFVALSSNGTVHCWSHGVTSPEYNPAIAPPPDLTNAIAVSAAGFHTLALRADGSVAAWGQPSEMIDVPENLTNAVAISAGYFWNMALTADGRLVSWGLPPMDPEDFSDRSVPEGLTNVISFSVGTGHALALTTNPIPCFTTHPRSRAVPLGWPVTLSASASGQGRLGYQWQFNGTDIPGATNTSYTIANVAEANLGEYRVIATNLLGTDTSRVARLVKGNVLAWGDNQMEQCWVPTSASNLVSLAVGMDRCLGLQDDGRIIGWGFLTSNHVAGITNMSSARAIAAGGSVCMAVLSNGTVKAWGHRPDLEAVVPPPLEGVVTADISLHDEMGVSLEDGSVVVWNRLSGLPFVDAVPESFTNIAKIFMVFDSGIGIRYDGTVSSFGRYGGATRINAVQVTGGYPPYFVLGADGTVLDLARGSKISGMTNIVSLAGISLALRTDGSVAYSDAQVPLPGPLSNVVEVASGYYPTYLARFGDGAPAITIEPYNRAIMAGSSFALSAFASGAPPLSYQWQFNGADIANATNASYYISDTGFQTAGNYRCIIANSLGSVTSRVAQVSVMFRPPSLSVVSRSDEEAFVLKVENLSAQGPCVIWGSTNLVDWVPLMTNAPGPVSFEARDIDWTNWHQRFYRVSEER